jgi:hypothetical protein
MAETEGLDSRQLGHSAGNARQKLVHPKSFGRKLFLLGEVAAEAAL